MASPHEVTHLLKAISNGDISAWKNVIPIVQHEIHRIARNAMKRENPNHTLSATALVNEIYIRFANKKVQEWNDRKHLFNAAAVAMRFLLIDISRNQNRKLIKGFIPLDGHEVSDKSNVNYLSALDLALDKFSAVDGHQQHCRVINLYFFSGMNFTNIAKELNLSRDTIRKYWIYSKAWLLGEIERIESNGR